MDTIQSWYVNFRTPNGHSNTCRTRAVTALQAIANACEEYSKLQGIGILSAQQAVVEVGIHVRPTTSGV